MYLVSLSLLFFLLVLLVVLYHMYGWNYSSSYSSRPWVCSFECGFLGQRLVENYFSHVYFSLLVFFVIFDLEISLLLNMPYQGEMYKNLFYYFIFLFVLALGFSIEVYNGYVRWSYWGFSIVAANDSVGLNFPDLLKCVKLISLPVFNTGSGSRHTLVWF